MVESLKNKKGVTIVELIAVFIIMAILTAIAVPATASVIRRQRENVTVESANAFYTVAKNALIEAQGQSVSSTHFFEGHLCSYEVKVYEEDNTLVYEVNLQDLIIAGEIQQGKLTSGGTFTLSNGKYDFIPEDTKSGMEFGDNVAYFNYVNQTFQSKAVE